MVGKLNKLEGNDNVTDGGDNDQSMLFLTIL